MAAATQVLDPSAATHPAGIGTPSSAQLEARPPGTQLATGEARRLPDGVFAALPVELDIVIPLPNFRVRNLLALDRGVIVESQWGHADDLPLTAGNVQLAWTEFEVVDSQIAVRLTRLN